MTCALAIGLLATPASGAVPRTSLPTDAAPVHSARCPSSREAVVRYRAHTWERQGARGGTLADRTPIVRGKSCHWARYAAGVWVARAKAAAKKLKAWRYEWNWQAWLPQPYRAIFQCETPIGNEGINWAHHAGSYEGGPGFYSGTWDSYKPAGYPAEAYDASPREQFTVAKRVAAAVGFGAWGCYSHGGYRYHL